MVCHPMQLTLPAVCAIKTGGNLDFGYDYQMVRIDVYAYCPLGFSEHVQPDFT